MGESERKESMYVRVCMIESEREEELNMEEGLQDVLCAFKMKSQSRIVLLLKRKSGSSANACLESHE